MKRRLLAALVLLAGLVYGLYRWATDEQYRGRRVYR